MPIPFRIARPGSGMIVCSSKNVSKLRIKALINKFSSYSPLCLTASNSSIAADTDTFSESSLPSIGIRI